MSAALLLLVAGNGYFGYGFGPGHNVDGELAALYTTEGEVGGRFVGGVRHGDTALDASFFGTDLHRHGAGSGDSDSTLSLGVGLKQFLPLSPNVELYARAGVDHTWLVPFPDRDDAITFSGWGFDYGAGVQAGTGAGNRWGIRAWLDLGRQQAQLHSDGGGAKHDGDALGATFTSVTVGFSVTR